MNLIVFNSNLNFEKRTTTQIQLSSINKTTNFKLNMNKKNKSCSIYLMICVLWKEIFKVEIFAKNLGKFFNHQQNFFSAI